jgi:ubiquinone/menaquinone biosynthesis C-methylase UbiE
MAVWTEFAATAVRERYDRIAPYYEIIERLLFIPPGIRKRAAARLELTPGHDVLEIGCGTGLNLRRLSDAVAHGHVYGVDHSEGMLSKARERCRSMPNVTLVREDALSFTAPKPLDAVLFSLSYNTIPHHRAVLGHAWNQLKSGGRLVIMDAKLPSGRIGEVILPAVVFIMRHTVAANPAIKPWEELRSVSRDVEMEHLLFSYYICRVIKSDDCEASVAYSARISREKVLDESTYQDS